MIHGDRIPHHHVMCRKTYHRPWTPVPSVPTVPTLPSCFTEAAKKIPLNHARYLQAFGLCASTNPSTTLLITACDSSSGVKDSLWKPGYHHESIHTCRRPMSQSATIRKMLRLTKAMIG